MPSFVEKLKRVPTAYWIAGGGAAALLVDLAIERDRSVLSSLWRGIVHHGEHAESAQAAAPAGGHGRGHPQAAPGGAPMQMQMLMPAPMYGLPMSSAAHHRHRRYYPAYPAQYGAAQHHRHHPQHPQSQAPWGGGVLPSHPPLHIPFHPQPWSSSG